MQTRQVDELLLPFIQTSDSAECEQLLSLLITQHAEPIITKIIRYKSRAGSTNKYQTETEEIRSEIILQLVQRLRNFRSDFQEKPIADFSSYVAVATYNAYDRYISRKYPNRRRLKNGLRYLLSHRAEFAVWQTSNGVWVGGFSRWQNSDLPNGSETLTQNRLQELQNDSYAFAREAAARKDWHDQKKGYELLDALFAWTNAPIDLDLLTGVVADWWNVTDEAVEIDAGNFAGESRESSAVQIADTRASVAVEAERRAFLQKLWQEILELPTRQRASLLLNLRDENGRGIIDLWLIVGIATVRAIAEALEMTPEKFAALWQELPLDDNRIAVFLEITRQQVINLRKSARERLARRMKAF